MAIAKFLPAGHKPETTNLSGGFATLFGVIILMTVTTIAVSSLGLIAKNTLTSSRVYLQGMKARFLAESCMELALEQIRQNTAYAGTVTGSFGADTCSATVTGGTSISSSGTSGSATKVKTATVTATTPILQTTNWVEN